MKCVRARASAFLFNAAAVAGKNVSIFIKQRVLCTFVPRRTIKLVKTVMARAWTTLDFDVDAEKLLVTLEGQKSEPFNV